MSSLVSVFLLLSLFTLAFSKTILLSAANCVYSFLSLSLPTITSLFPPRSSSPFLFSFDFFFLFASFLFIIILLYVLLHLLALYPYSFSLSFLSPAHLPCVPIHSSPLTFSFLFSSPSLLQFLPCTSHFLFFSMLYSLIFH